MTTSEILKKARNAKSAFVTIDTAKKNEALLAMAASIEAETKAILLQNSADINAQGFSKQCYAGPSDAG